MNKQDLLKLIDKEVYGSLKIVLINTVSIFLLIIFYVFNGLMILPLIAIPAFLLFTFTEKNYIEAMNEYKQKVLALPDDDEVY